MASPVVTPSDFRRRLKPPPAKAFYRGLDALRHRLVGFGKRHSGKITRLLSEADEVEKITEFAALTDAELRARLAGFREEFPSSQEVCPEVLVPAVAAVCEAVKRRLGLTPYREQIAGALGLHRGWLIEMATGEGKTLTAGIAAVLAGWRGRPCHVVTVNDYLVERDASNLGNLHRFCGLTTAHVTGSMAPEERKAAYEADIVYVTSKELLADFLRDRLKLGNLQDAGRWMIRRLIRPDQSADKGLVLRGVHSVIVDEADSVLIDEAVTPLIISSPRENPDLQLAIELAQKKAEELSLGTDYRVNQRYREIEFTKLGRAQLEEWSALLPAVWRGAARAEELVRLALSAKEFYHKGRQYVILDDKITIVDEFTGRAMPNRTWREGLHQAIEVSEDVAMSHPNETLASMSFQRFFRMFPHVSGMTGTAWEAASELWNVYHLLVVRIPTHQPCKRVRWCDRIFTNRNAKLDAVVESIAALHHENRPVLVGTRSVYESEELSSKLAAEGIQHQILNAVRHSEEAAIVAHAGELGRVTIATNMAGRGTDILLGPNVRNRGGLHVIAVERHDSERIDRQLFGRSGRQGDPGSAQAFVCCEDELVSRHISVVFVRFLRLCRSSVLYRWAWRTSQRRAESLAYRQRSGVLRHDTWLDESLSFARKT